MIGRQLQQSEGGWTIIEMCDEASEFSAEKIRQIAPPLGKQSTEKILIT